MKLKRPQESTPICTVGKRKSDFQHQTYGLWKSSSSTSKLSVAPGGMTGGEPRSPYAIEDGHTTCAFSPFFIFCSASVQQGTTPFSPNSAGSPRLIELSKTVPSMSLPS